MEGGNKSKRKFWTNAYQRRRIPAQRRSGHAQRIKTLCSCSCALRRFFGLVGGTGYLQRRLEVGGSQDSRRESGPKAFSHQRRTGRTAMAQPRWTSRENGNPQSQSSSQRARPDCSMRDWAIAYVFQGLDISPRPAKRRETAARVLRGPCVRWSLRGSSGR